MNTPVIDQKARDMAQAAANKVQAHEDKCEVRWQDAMATMREIKSILAYGTAGLITAMLGLIGFLATHPLPH